MIVIKGSDYGDGDPRRLGGLYDLVCSVCLLCLIASHYKHGVNGTQYYHEGSISSERPAVDHP